MSYSIIREAMEDRQQIQCTYQGHVRMLCAHTLGTKDGREKMLAFQFGGGSSKGLPPGGEWRCMFVDQLEGVAAIDGEWHSGGPHSKPQTCVDLVDLEIFA